MVPTINGGNTVHWTGRHLVTNVQRFGSKNEGDGGDLFLN